MQDGQIGFDTHNEPVFAREVWNYIYEGVTNNPDVYDVKRFTRIAEQVVPTVQKDGDHYHLYVTDHLDDSDDVVFMRITCETAMISAFEDYNISEQMIKIV